jgi:ATP-dependent Clp protease protease subunit
MSIPAQLSWPDLPDRESNAPTSYIPYVIERTGRGERTYDIYSRLLEDRIVIVRAIDSEEMANSIVAQLLFLEKSGPNQDVKMYIQSPGGLVTAGLAIYDTMKMISCDIQTFVMGQAASMGASLLAGGTKGKRFALPSARIMIHQLSGGTRGKFMDMEVDYKESKRLHDLLRGRLAADCDKTLEELDAAMMPTDHFMSPEEAKEFGLIDEVLAYPDAKTGDAKKS